MQQMLEPDAIQYVRQSRENEETEDLSPEMQKKKNQMQAEIDGSLIVKTFEDVDYSGWKIHWTRRDGLRELFDYLNIHNKGKNKKIKKLYVYAFSRISRKLKEFLEIVDLLENKYGLSVISVKEKVDTNTPTGRMLRNIMASFNEYYSDNLSDTMKDVAAERASRGERVSGHVPYGYKQVHSVTGKSEDVIDEDIAKWVIYMKDRWLSGISIYRICRELDLHGVPLPATNSKLRKKTHWTEDTVKYFLQNPWYSGYVWGPDGQLVKGKHQGIWDLETYELIMKRFKKGHYHFKKHLLSSLLYCSECGRRFEMRYRGTTKAKRYVCTTKVGKYRDRKCSMNAIDQESIDALVIQRLKAFFQDTIMFDEIIDELKKEENRPSHQKAKIESLKKEIG